jgi:hypothetical protein
MPMNIVKTGTWLYDGSAEMPVDIVGLEYDWYYEIDKVDDLLEEDDQPIPLGEEGLLYHVRFQRAGDTESLWIDGGCYQRLEDAMKAAQERTPSPIKWKDD